MSARFAFLVPMISAAAGAQEVAQEQGQLPTDQAIPGLMFFTLGAVLLIAVGD